MYRRAVRGRRVFPGDGEDREGKEQSFFKPREELTTRNWTYFVLLYVGSWNDLYLTDEETEVQRDKQLAQRHIARMRQ